MSGSPSVVPTISFDHLCYFQKENCVEQGIIIEIQRRQLLRLYNKKTRGIELRHNPHSFPHILSCQGSWNTVIHNVFETSVDW